MESLNGIVIDVFKHVVPISSEHRAVVTGKIKSIPVRREERGHYPRRGGLGCEWCFACKWQDLKLPHLNRTIDVKPWKERQRTYEPQFDERVRCRLGRQTTGRNKMATERNGFVGCVKDGGIAQRDQPPRGCITMTSPSGTTLRWQISAGRSANEKPGDTFVRCSQWSYDAWMDDLSPADEGIRDGYLAAARTLAEELANEGTDLGDGPDTLYHYTRAEGLRGILSDGCIFVPRAACLNDPEEVKYGENLARKVLAERAAEQAESKAVSPLVKLLHEVATGPPVDSAGRPSAPGWTGEVRFDPFVASFSAEPDLIGMWAYFARDGGYAVGFKRAELPVTIGADTFNLSRVIYDVNEQRRIFRRAIEKFEDLIAQTFGAVSVEHQLSSVSVAAFLLWTLFRTLAVRMKAPAFEPEKEWRLVTTAVEGPDTPDPDGLIDASHMYFRSVGSRIIPYFRAEYGRGKVPIVSIRSGPTVDGIIAKDSILRMLKGTGYPWRDIEIDSSQFSLRE